MDEPRKRLRKGFKNMDTEPQVKDIVKDETHIHIADQGPRGSSHAYSVSTAIMYSMLMRAKHKDQAIPPTGPQEKQVVPLASDFKKHRHKLLEHKLLERKIKQRNKRR